MKPYVCGICKEETKAISYKTKDGLICSICMEHLPMKLFNKTQDYTCEDLANIAKSYDLPDNFRRASYGEPRKATEKPVQTPDPFVLMEKYKDLLDKGIITQEEFNLKKKELLGL